MTFQIYSVSIIPYQQLMVIIEKFTKQNNNNHHSFIIISNFKTIILDKLIEKSIISYILFYNYFFLIYIKILLFTRK